MPKKTNATLVALAILAAVSVFGLFRVLKIQPNARVAGAQDSGISFDLPKDTDGDGLDDREESYWNTDFEKPDTDGDGFLDGEEIASGHDPRKADPDDGLTSIKPQNVTERAGNLVLAGLAEGSLKENSPQFEPSIHKIVNDIFYQALINQTAKAPAITSTLNISSDTAIDAGYLTQMTVELDELSTRTNNFFLLMRQVETLNLESPGRDEPFFALLDAEIAALTNQFTRIQTMTIPQRRAQTHQSLILAIQEIIAQYKLLAEVKQDGIQGISAIFNVGFLFIGRLQEAMSVFQYTVRLQQVPDYQKLQEYTDYLNQ